MEEKKDRLEVTFELSLHKGLGKVVEKKGHTGKGQ